MCVPPNVTIFLHKLKFNAESHLVLDKYRLKLCISQHGFSMDLSVAGVNILIKAIRKH